MGCLTASERSRLTARLEKYETMIDALYDAFLNFDDVKGYTFDSGAGKQATTYRTTTELERTISRLTATADQIRRKLNGTSNPAMNLRRKPGCYGNY